MNRSFAERVLVVVMGYRRVPMPVRLFAPPHVGQDHWECDFEIDWPNGR